MTLSARASWGLAALITGLVSALVPSGAAAAVTAPEVVPPAAVAVKWLDGDEALIGYRAGSQIATSVRLVRTAPGEPALVRDLPADRTELADRGLVIGRTYTYEVTAVTAGALSSAPRTVRLVATARPVLTVGALSTTGPFRVGVRAGGSTSQTRYTVTGYVLPPTDRFLSVPSSRPVPWLEGAAGTSFVFGGPAAPGQRATAAVPGQTYRFAGYAVDAFGHRTLGSASRRAVVPFDQSRAALTGAASSRRPDAYGGSVALLGAGDAATVRLLGDQVTVLGERCPTCGVMDVVLDGRRVARVDTRAGTRRSRQVLWTGSFVLERATTLSLGGAGVPGRTPVVLDGIGVRRESTRVGFDRFTSMARGSTIYSANSRHRVTYRHDGDVVVGPVGGRPVFSTRTAGSILPTTSPFAGAFLVSASCDLRVFDRDNKPVWRSGTTCPPAEGLGQEAGVAIIQDDGNLVLYRRLDGRPLWSSRTGRL